jgi:hypothetical protein
MQTQIVSRRRTVMTRLPTLITAVFILGCGALDVNAQQNPGGPMMQMPGQTQQQPPAQGGAATNQQGATAGTETMGRGMMGCGMMGRGMMGGMMGRGMMGGMTGRGMMGGMMGPGGMMDPLSMRIMFALMDADGDGTVSLQEFQTAHERIFKAMDANKDGVLSLEEIQSFMRGTSMPAQQPPGPATPQRP